jgi:diacylglycerol kinase family enzyme
VGRIDPPLDSRSPVGQVGGTVIGLITNPTTHGRSRERGLARRLRALAGADARVFERRTLGELAEAVAACVGLGVDAVGVCGGDGTGLAVLSELVGSSPARAAARAN